MTFEATGEVLRNTSPNSQLQQKYGDNFFHAYQASHRFAMDDLRSFGHEMSGLKDLPYLDQIIKIDQEANSARFIKWRNEKGVEQWRYLIEVNEKNPSGKGKYGVNKVYRYNDAKKEWIQEMTTVDPSDEVKPFFAQVEKAVKPNLREALQSQLGSSFYEAYRQSGTVNQKDITNLPDGANLSKLLPPGNVRVRQIEILEPCSEKSTDLKLPQNYYVIEQQKGSARLVQVLKVGEVPDFFENVFLGVEDLNTSRVLVINDIYKEMDSIISTTNLRFNHKCGAIGIGRGPFPLMMIFLPRIGLEPQQLINKLVGSAYADFVAIGHELGHAAYFKSCDTETQQKMLNRMKATYDQYILPMLTSFAIFNGVPNLLLRGDPSILMASCLMLTIGNTVTGNEWLKAELAADRYSLFFIQALRSFGVDILDRIPDGQIELQAKAKLLSPFRAATKLNMAKWLEP